MELISLEGALDIMMYSIIGGFLLNSMVELVSIAIDGIIKILKRA